METLYSIITIIIVYLVIKKLEKAREKKLSQEQQSIPRPDTNSPILGYIFHDLGEQIMTDNNIKNNEISYHLVYNYLFVLSFLIIDELLKNNSVKINDYDLYQIKKRCIIDIMHVTTQDEIVAIMTAIYCIDEYNNSFNETNKLLYINFSSIAKEIVALKKKSGNSFSHIATEFSYKISQQYILSSKNSKFKGIIEELAHLE